MDVKLRNMTSVYLSKNGKMLLLYRQGGRVVNDLWVGSAGGHFEPEELNDPRACVLRELQEETGLTEDALEELQLRYVTARFVHGEIRQNYYFFAKLREEVDPALSSSEGVLRWFALSELEGLEMPLSARHMMDHYLRTGRFDGKLYAGVSAPGGVVFSELADI